MSSKKRASLYEAMAGQDETDSGAGAAVVALAPLPAKGARKAEKATVYLPKAAVKRIKQMALDQDKRINDLLQEGVDLMLAKYGQPSLKEFEAK